MREPGFPVAFMLGDNDSEAVSQLIGILFKRCVEVASPEQQQGVRVLGLQISVLLQVGSSIFNNVVTLDRLQDRLLQELEVELTRCGILIHMNLHDAIGFR